MIWSAERQPVTVSLYATWLRLRWPQGSADFHLRWLRHHCPAERHPLTGEHTLCSSSIPDEVSAEEVRIEGETLLIRWAHEERTSRYPLAWLWENAYARNREAAPPPPGDLSQIEITCGTVTEGVEAALRILAAHGAALVRRGERRAPPEEETEAIIAAFAERGFVLVPSHFGRIEDLRTDNTTNQNTDQLGYTDAPIDLHTDQPFLENPPRYQLLHSIRAADEGGESMLADGLAAALYLRDHDVLSFRLLCEVSVRFHRKQKNFESLYTGPLLRFSGQRFQVRSSYFTMAPHQIPFVQMEAWYRAHDRFIRLLRNPAHHYRFLLMPGDFLLYDNHRMLHARTGFRGARWVWGVYFDRQVEPR